MQDDHVQQERDLFKNQFLKIQSNYEKKIRELSILKELGDALRSSNIFNKSTFWNEQMGIIKSNTHLDMTSLMLVDQNNQALVTEAAVGAAASCLQRDPIAIKDAIQGLAVIQKTPVIIDSIRDNALTKKQFSSLQGSLLCIPILHNNNALGVLVLYEKKPAAFDKEQVRFFSLVADQIATAIILSRLYHQMLQEEKHRFLLSRFFSKTVMEKILESKDNIRPGGERKDVTILFADLKDFTSLSEKIDQEQVVEILNSYFSRVTPVLFNNGGTLDKIMGDGIMALFGAPIPQVDAGVRAVQTAIEMTHALESFNAENRHRGWPELELSIGINSGEVVAGYIGSEEHLNYTVIGDAVNVAERLQHLAGTNRTLISESVMHAIQDRVGSIPGILSVQEQPLQKLRGKEQAVTVYALDVAPCNKG